MALLTPHSYKLTTIITDDIFNAPVSQVYIWCTSSNFSQWRISLKFAHLVRELQSIHIHLRPTISFPNAGSSFVQTSNPPGSRNSTVVTFMPGASRYTVTTIANDRQVDLAQAQTALGIRVRDVVDAMALHIPFYELRADDVGNSHWVYAHFENLLNKGVIIDTPGTRVLDTIKNKIVQYNLRSNNGYVFSEESHWPPTRGTVHYGPP